ncbi:hypothetical protein [Parvicella tangerina]|uniref:Uncharacterized protein n=1 Tax=Parvicella tangerina TaxID=2829795 RepID=A0A916NIA7_9FLAO|nr:hypothetical protein [Parvicella tangerina]CAG5083594.1 hypothetical protein CRYO30217_02239 [Parvicella tangerina]
MIRTVLLLLFSLKVLSTFSMIDPFYKEVMQRGYQILAGDSVKFPDGSICAIEDFNNLDCGKQWMTEDYCIPEGEAVWDDNKCCDGLEPYLEEGVAGQATCEKIKKKTTSSETTDDEDEEGFAGFLGSSTVLYFFIGVLIPLSLFVILAISVKKRLPKKED